MLNTRPTKYTNSPTANTGHPNAGSGLAGDSAMVWRKVQNSQTITARMMAP